jgi:glycosyltransferase involved in cell wall biosynthesis
MHLVGWLSDLREFYEAVDVVVLTSANEGTPISLIEAGAAGRPVVSTRVGGVADVVDHGSSGYVVDSSPEVARAVIELVTHPGLARRMGAAGRRRVLARYDSARLAADLISIYEREIRINESR